MKTKYNPIFEYNPRKPKKNRNREESLVEVIALCGGIFGVGFLWMVIGAVVGG
jgi:hypothetical protein